MIFHLSLQNTIKIHKNRSDPFKNGYQRPPSNNNKEILTFLKIFCNIIFDSTVNIKETFNTHHHLTQILPQKFRTLEHQTGTKN